MAHELGHALGARHDNQTAAAEGNWIMKPTVSSVWSDPCPPAFSDASLEDMGHNLEALLDREDLWLLDEGEEYLAERSWCFVDDDGNGISDEQEDEGMGGDDLGWLVATPVVLAVTLVTGGCLLKLRKRLSRGSNVELNRAA